MVCHTAKGPEASPVRDQVLRIRAEHRSLFVCPGGAATWMAGYKKGEGVCCWQDEIEGGYQAQTLSAANRARPIYFPTYSAVSVLPRLIFLQIKSNTHRIPHRSSDLHHTARRCCTLGCGNPHTPPGHHAATPSAPTRESAAVMARAVVYPPPFS